MSRRATLDHFELSVTELERTASFLERVFGWTAGPLSTPGDGRYLRLRAAGGASESTNVRVGLFEETLEAGYGRDSAVPGLSTLPVVRVDGERLEDCLERVNEEGGRIVAAPKEVRDSGRVLGRFARFADPDGHEWGLWEAAGSGL